MPKESKRTVELLRQFVSDGQPMYCYTYPMKSQEELAKKLKISRQALHVHLARMIKAECILIGKGFLLITAAGYRKTADDKL